MKHDTCPICNSSGAIEWYSGSIDEREISFIYKFNSLTQKTLRVVKCLNCTHVFCSPLPKQFYKNYKDVVDEEYLRYSETRLLTTQAVLKILNRYAASGEILDVGCATGDFLLVSKNFGYSVEGLELSRWSSEITRKKGIPVYANTLSLLARRFPKKYDMITLWGVIEHFEQPFKEMQYVNRLLKPGGVLAIWTGDVNGLMSKLLGRRWWYWQGQHIQYFTHKSLNYLTKRTGFEHLSTKIYPLAVSYEQVENSLARYAFQQYILWIVKLIFILKPIWYLRFPGEMLWIGKKI